MILVYLLAVLIGVSRFVITPHPASLAGSYEAAAHLLVGGLLGAWWTSRVATRRGQYGDDTFFRRDHRLLGMALALTAVELAAVGLKFLPVPGAL